MTQEEELWIGKGAELQDDKGGAGMAVINEATYSTKRRQLQA